MAILIKTPCIVTADDYHEFDVLQELFIELTGKHVYFKEYEAVDYDPRKPYSAVFYVRGEAPQVKKMVRKLESDKELR